MSSAEMDQNSAIVASVEARLQKKMFDLALPYVTEGELLPPIGKPSDFLHELSSINLAELGFSSADHDEIKRRVALDNFPLPALQNREGYTGDLYYWVFGLSDYLRLVDACKRYGIRMSRIFDFGGSTGRAFRHFAAQSPPGEIFSCDFRAVSVDWCRKYFGDAVKVFLNTVIPSLPIEDNFFDVITAYSVFTHIDAFEEAWLLELRRILKPGGLLCLTIGDENTWRIMPNHLRDRLKSSPDAVGIDFSSSRMPFNKKSFRFASESHYALTVFRDQSYIWSRWGQYIQIREVVEAAHGPIQSVVLATK
jgi:SAM-dependent methyltransferase